MIKYLLMLLLFAGAASAEERKAEPAKGKDITVADLAERAYRLSYYAKMKRDKQDRTLNAAVDAKSTTNEDLLGLFLDIKKTNRTHIANLEMYMHILDKLRSATPAEDKATREKFEKMILEHEAERTQAELYDRKLNRAFLLLIQDDSEHGSKN